MYRCGTMLFETFDQAVDHYVMMLKMTGIEVEIIKVIDDE